MPTTHWNRKLGILLPGALRPRFIEDIRNAMYVLAELWPVTYGKAYQRALAFCTRALEGRTSAARARLAFIAAAREARVEIVA
ncbi:MULTISPECIES: DUF982 domain-containing protein [unclassified Shinella]|uniref:DUF982 domain-containing protein n=1 Tax=unclassified Shinella TaxID=2643062 RepID=UPI00225D1E80|nr:MULTISPECIES: DUF982 domain-containing protein [unclassified Shinella]MCO5140314.1 DUF982 domain-containing protein [Shinella sp.]MDC7254964.1 DUF982 domain-containing protein [Shinella sp. YE25]CAI0337717.1 conserved hypothetical protein [Rhizobiaceae bacterium]CAK7256193.1 conserved protein of unknown function [Shinella sp. WSC3-e]